MLETIGKLLGGIAIYITALLGLIALFFLWVAFREWRAGSRAVFGVERDIAASEMVGALARAGGVAVIALLVFGLGALGRQAESEEGQTAQATRRPQGTPAVAPAATFTPGGVEPGPTLLPTDTLPPELTDVPPLPPAQTDTPPVQPTPQTAVIVAFGGVWLRDAPNGGTIVVVPQDSVVELLAEERQFSGNFEWQKVRILSAPLGSEAQAGQEGWVAFSPEFLQVSP